MALKGIMSTQSRSQDVWQEMNHLAVQELDQLERAVQRRDTGSFKRTMDKLSWLCGSDKLHLSLLVGSILKEVCAMNSLLHVGLDPNVVKLRPIDPPHHDHDNISAEFVRIILSYDVGTNSLIDTDNSPLLLAAGYGNTEVVRLLLDHGCELNRGVKVPPANLCTGYPKLDWYIRNYKPTNFTMYADFRDDEEFATSLDYEVRIGGMPKESNDAGMNNPWAATWLQRPGSRWSNEPGPQGKPEWATDMKALSAMSRLTQEGSTALHQAAGRGHVDTVRLLVEAGVDVQRYDWLSRTALGRAAQHDYPEVMRVLLATGQVDTECRYGDGMPAILDSVWSSEEKLRVLLEYGSSVNVRDKNGRTPFMHVTRWCRETRMRLLIRHNCTLDASAIESLTLSMEQLEKVAAILIQYGGADMCAAFHRIHNRGAAISSSLVEQFTNPLTLAHLCFVAIRKHLPSGRRFFAAVESLPVPGKIKDYLALSELENL